MADVYVVGGGPAGVAASVRLAQMGASVTLYDKACFPRPKLCGGFISAEALPELEMLGVLDSIDRLGALKIRRIGISSPSGAYAESPLAQPGISVSRLQLDEILMRKAKACGVTVVHEKVARVQLFRGTPLTIWATGLQPTPSHWFGMQAYFSPIPELTDQVEVHFVTGGYVGLVRQGESSNLCALLDRDALKGSGADLDKVLRRFAQMNPMLGRRLREAGRLTEWKTIAGVLPGVRRLAEDGILYVGDAACVVDPFIGEGISMALRSGGLAAKSLASAAPAETYSRSWHEAFDRSLHIQRLLRRIAGTRAGQECVARFGRHVPLLSWFAERSRPPVLSTA